MSVRETASSGQSQFLAAPSPISLEVEAHLVWNMPGRFAKKQDERNELKGRNKTGRLSSYLG